MGQASETCVGKTPFRYTECMVVVITPRSDSVNSGRQTYSRGNNCDTLNKKEEQKDKNHLKSRTREW